MLGFINIYKPREISSAFAVSKFKKKVKEKCGHMGTLDPLASGILPIGLKQSTRLFPYLLDKEKEYIAEFDFSFSTPSFDTETETIKINNYIPTINEINNILHKYIGEISQIPPEFSAKLVDGKRSYNLARKGEKVLLKHKNVKISNIELINKCSETSFKFKINCFGGTYIRSLARDLGNEFGSPATMVKLERTKCGVFVKENSVNLNDFLDSNDIEKYLIKPESVISFPSIILNDVQSKRILNGLYDDYFYSNGLYKVFNENVFLGVGEINENKLKIKSYVRDL